MGEARRKRLTGQSGGDGTAQHPTRKEWPAFVIIRHGVAPINADYVQDFCMQVDANSSAVEVKCAPVKGDLKDCFPLVEKQVQNFGGSLVLGWAIWEIVGQMVEAELHSVWRSAEGDLLDISPRERRFNSITFLPDTKGLNFSRQVDNIRRPLNDDPRIHKFIDLHRQRFALLNEGDLADKMGVVELSPQAASELYLIEREMENLPFLAVE